MAKECETVLVKDFKKSEVKKAADVLRGLYSDPEKAFKTAIKALYRPVRKTPGSFFCFCFKTIFDECFVVMNSASTWGQSLGKQC